MNASLRQSPRDRKLDLLKSMAELDVLEQAPDMQRQKMQQDAQNAAFEHVAKMYGLHQQDQIIPGQVELAHSQSGHLGSQARYMDSQVEAGLPQSVADDNRAHAAAIGPSSVLDLLKHQGGPVLDGKGGFVQPPIHPAALEMFKQLGIDLGGASAPAERPAPLPMAPGAPTTQSPVVAGMSDYLNPSWMDLMAPVNQPHKIYHAVQTGRNLAKRQALTH